MNDSTDVKLAKFQIIEQPEVVIVGKVMRFNMDPSRAPEAPPALWDRCFADGTFTTLEALTDYIHDPAYVGYMDSYDPATGGFDYICGMFMKPGVPVPDGYVARVLAPTKIGVGWIQGPKDNEQALYAPAHPLTEEALRKEVPDFKYTTWSAEVYAEPRITTPDADGNIILDYYIPFE